MLKIPIRKYIDENDKSHETIKKTILQSKSGKRLEIENRVDPKLWHSTKVKKLESENSRENKEFLFIVFAILMMKLGVLQSKSDMFWRPGNILLNLLFIVTIALFIPVMISNYKDLKYYENMSSIEDNYIMSYKCLDINFYDYEFLHLLDVYTLVNFCEKDFAIMFNYINTAGDYVTRDVNVCKISRNIYVPHTKIIMYEYGLECIIPYKLEEKTSENQM